MRVLLEIFLFFLSFYKIKDYYYWKYKFYRLFISNPATGLLQIGCKLRKWQWRHNFPKWCHYQIFWSSFVSNVKFSYWSNFRVNFSTGYGFMTTSFYKGLTRNPEIANTTVWVLPKILRLARVKDTRFVTNISNKMLQNAVKY